MRSALTAGLITTTAILWFSLPSALSNVDFAYMCVGGAMLDDLNLLVTPYFPPGYPILLWLLVKTGMAALTAGTVLSAIGTGLSAAALAFFARYFGVPAAPALALGILGVTLPDVFLTAFNPHLDALYTGLALVLIAAACKLLGDKPAAATVVVFALAGVLLIVLRYHAVLVVIPVIIVVLVNRRVAVRKAALAALACALLALGWIYWSQYVTYGEIASAASTQIAMGIAYRELPPGDQITIFREYDKWLLAAPAVGVADIVNGVLANWPDFLLRKAVVIGLMLWLAALLVYRRQPPYSLLLVLFIVLYTMAVSPTYFTPRASALTELAGLALAAAALGLLFKQEPGKQKNKRKLRLDPGLAGALLFFACLGGIVWNLYRELPLMDNWRNRRHAVTAVDSYLRETTSGKGAVYGSMDNTSWYFDRPWSLSGPTYTRYWMDDPLVAPLVDGYLPRVRHEDALAADPPFEAVVLWQADSNHIEQDLAQQLETSTDWREDDSPVSGVRIWRRE